VNNTTREENKRTAFSEAEKERKKRKWRRGSGGEEVGWYSCAIPTGTG
jgi:hypothetical protein